jgi:hypothetical protein
MSDILTNEAVLEAEPALVHMQRFRSSRRWLERVQGAMGGIAPAITHPSACCFGHSATLVGGPGTTEQRLCRACSRESLLYALAQVCCLQAAFLVLLRRQQA